MTLEDLSDFVASYDEPIRRSKTRLEIKRETTSVNLDEKIRFKLRRPSSKCSTARPVKSAPTMNRSKSQLIIPTRRKDLPKRNSIVTSRPNPVVI